MREDPPAAGHAAAVAALHGFWSAMFDHEVRYYQELRAGQGHDHSTQVFARAEADRAEIFAEHCTPKKRVYSVVAALGESPRYDPLLERVDSVVEESARRVVVDTSSAGVFRSQRHRYVLVRRGERWLVDTVQVYDDLKAAWVRGIL